jgi:hypothetical protein
LARGLCGWVFDHLVGPGTIFLASDDTVSEHFGDRVFGKGCHRDPVRSTHSFTAFRWGHKGVVLAVLVRFPFTRRRGLVRNLVSGAEEGRTTQTLHPLSLTEIDVWTRL